MSNRMISVCPLQFHYVPHHVSIKLQLLLNSSNYFTIYYKVSFISFGTHIEMIEIVSLVENVLRKHVCGPRAMVNTFGTRLSKSGPDRK